MLRQIISWFERVEGADVVLGFQESSAHNLFSFIENKLSSVQIRINLRRMAIWHLP